MAVTPKRFAKGLGSTALTTVYTVPANTIAILKAITLCNTSANGEVDFTMSLGGTKIINSHKIKAFDTITIPFLDQVILAGETIQIQSASGAVVSYIMSGKEVT
ncbi:hypothetical protein BK129_01445 [Paenibacillus amylolyticus]|uniref:hypothetical protein n=1 Tax=Paenibacillus amylolyticus TaxID=1451 RepID=UPI00096F2F2C|nr:hypothetical protein [Paenibacillus amylolyticus]OMF09547.1 hypothetical protein BK129_01445 [Paenibacillus amylolyticus]